MVNVSLIISAVVLSTVILVTAFFVLIRFSHPDDKSTAYFPKGIVVFGLYVACATVLTLPFDVANSVGAGGGLDVATLWQIVFITATALIIVIIPFAFFYYESEVDPDAVKSGELTQWEGQLPT
eukprot:800534_1